MWILFPLGFPGVSVVKNPPANVGDMGLIPGSGRSAGEGNGNPFQYSCWEIPWTEELLSIYITSVFSAEVTKSWT